MCPIGFVALVFSPSCFVVPLPFLVAFLFLGGSLSSHPALSRELPLCVARKCPFFLFMALLQGTWDTLRLAERKLGVCADMATEAEAEANRVEREINQVTEELAFDDRNRCASFLRASPRTNVTSLYQILKMIKILPACVVFSKPCMCVCVCVFVFKAIDL